MKKVITFGEIMLRLSPDNGKRILQEASFQATFGGAESNVAVSLANFGLDAEFVTKLPENPIGDAAINTLRSFGVDTKNIARGGERVGIYYMEKGAGPRGSVCVYDRKYSAISACEAADFDWDSIFAGADWFHFTGITPALGKNVYEVTLAACKAAKERGIKISCDLNFRKKLWSTSEAQEAMTELCKYVDVCIANEEDAKDVFGIEASGTDINSGKLSKEGYKEVATELKNRFNFEYVAITLRSSYSADNNDWAAMLYDGNDFYFSKEYHLTDIVDRVGGGDSFGAGLIYSLVNGKDAEYAVNFAVSASAMKHTIEGDFNRVKVSEVEKLMGGDGSGRVQR